MAIHVYEEETIYSNVGTYYLKADMYENSVSVANNTSNVTIKAILRSKSGSSFSGSGGTLYVDWWDNKTNSWTNKGSVSVSSLSSAASKDITETFNVTHNNNGALRGEVRARWERGSNAYAPVSSNVYTDETSLSTIPRQSTIAISKHNQSIADNVILVTLDRKLSSYTDTISWSCGNLSETLQTKSSTTKIALYFDDDAYVNISPPSGYTKKRSTYSNADLMNLILSWSSSSTQNPNQTMVFTTTTYNGNTSIGSNTYNFKYEIYQTPFINNLSYETTDALSSTLTGATDIVINDISKVLVTNTLTKNQYFNDNVQASSYTFTASNVGGVTQASNSYEFSKILGPIIRAMATDARNKSTSMSQGAIELNSAHFKNYTTPVISSLVASRPESTSSVINWKVEGTFWNDSFGVVSNTLHIYYRYKVDNGNYNSYTEVTPTISSNDFEYTGQISVVSTSEATLEIKIVDSANSEYILETTIPKGKSIFDIGDEYFNVNGVLAENGVRVKTLDNTYPVGSIVITETNTNPGTTLGGTWTLVDKEFKYKMVTHSDGAITRNTSNCTTANCWVTTVGHTIFIECKLTPSVNITDSTIELATLDFSTIGITTFEHNLYCCGYSDGGNAIIMFEIINATGKISSLDVVRRDGGSMPSGNTSVLEICTHVSKDDMIDSHCDKFYWKRTA